MRRNTSLVMAGAVTLIVVATLLIVSASRPDATTPNESGGSRPAPKAVVTRCGTELPPERSGRAIGTDIAVVRLTNPTDQEAEISVDIAFNRDGTTSALATGTALVPAGGTAEVTLRADGPPAEREVITGGLMKCTVERIAAR